MTAEGKAIAAELRALLVDADHATDGQEEAQHAFRAGYLTAGIVFLVSRLEANE